MHLKKRNKIYSILILILIPFPIIGQPVVVDKIVGIVGKNHIMYSEVEEQYMQIKAQGRKQELSKCEVFEDLLSQKLLTNQAGIDSLEIDPVTVEMELNDRIKYFKAQIGSEEKLIEYFGKSILEIKEDMRNAVRDQMLMQMMQREIISSISITPEEVRTYYSKLDNDSIPFIDARVELNQIILYPKYGDKAEFEVKEKLLGLRERIVNGENFATLAVLYSEDPSSSRGGDIGWANRANLDPEYAKVAMSLKKNQVSKIVESSFGFHLIQLIDREGNRLHTRHILMNPEIPFEEKEKTKARMDSIIQLIRIDTLTFEKAANYLSEDKNTRMNGGLRVNPATGNTFFELDQFETAEYYIIRNLNIGEISDTYVSTDDKGKLVYKIVRLKTKTEPHRANPKDDFELLKQMTIQHKQGIVVDKWVEEKIKSTYIRINDPFKGCNFRIEGWL